MPFRGLGYTVDDAGKPEQLGEQLAAVIEAGYTHAEIDPQDWDVFHGGRLVQANLDRFVPIAAAFRDRLGYAMHGPFHVNLFNLDQIERGERTLINGVEIAAAVGAEVMVYHPGYRLAPPAQAGVTMDELLERERDVLRRVADVGARDGVAIAVETFPPVGEWSYTYAVWPELLAKQVAAIDHPGVGVCIDFGHLYLAARWYGFDVVAGTETLAPWTNHFHVQDLFGLTTTGDDLAETGDDDGKYYESVGLEDAFHPQTILAYEMNGAALPVPHGAPLRLRVERQLGYKMAKYVMGIEAVENVAGIRGGRGGFWEDRGYEWYAGI